MLSELDVINPVNTVESVEFVAGVVECNCIQQ